MSTIKGHRFHPFHQHQVTQPSGPLVSGSTQSLKTSDLLSSPLLNYLGYRFHTKHLVLICVACEYAILPINALGHVKNQHGIFASKEQQALWIDTCTELNITTGCPVPLPKGSDQVELLKVHSDAYCCNCCDYACLTVTTFSKHWGTQHNSSDLRPSDRHHRGYVQTFYSHAPCTYFEVAIPISNSTTLFDVYSKKEIPNYAPFNVAIPSAPREIPPLLYNTRWHEHLADYITDKKERESLFTLAHPSKISKTSLWKLVWDYLSTVSNVAKDTSMRVRCLLTEYPRSAQKVDPWKYHLTKDTQRLYAYPLHSLAYSILQAHKGHPTNYKFPLPPDFTQHIEALESCLEETTDTRDHLHVFHDFIYPLLSAQQSIHEEDKWSMVLECWLALYTLQIEGNFSDPSELTGILAKLEYSCRAVTFYQAYLYRGDFPDESLYMAVEHYCNLNIKTGGLHPFNTLIEYQRFASALSYANPNPPTTTLSADAKTVTYKDKTIHLDDWILGMRQAYNDSMSLVQNLCGRKDFSIDLPQDFVDNMSDASYGYSWLDAVNCIEPAALMKHLMSNTEGNLPCKMGWDETLIWDSAWQLSWMRMAGDLNQLLANLHHTVPGQPSRVAELCDFRLRNGLRGRNIFYNHGDIWLITRRVKSETLVQHEEFIPVKLPPELCTLYKIYLVIIRPVEIDFARRLWGDDAATLYHEYLYVMNGDRLFEDHFYIQFKRWTGSYFKCAIGVRGYRQAVIVVARAYLGTEYELQLEEEDDALIKQRGHGSLADRRCYGVQSAYLTTLSSDLMFRFGHMSEWWWRLTQFAPGMAPLLPLDLRRKSHPGDVYCSVQPSLPTAVQHSSFDEDRFAAMVSAGIATAIRSLKNEMDGIIQTSVASGVAEVLARQATLTESLSRQSSGTLIATNTSMDTDPPFLDPTLELTQMSKPSGNTVLDPMDVDSQDASGKATHYLKLFYKDRAAPQFRSNGQQRMVELAFAGTQNFVGVLPTGGGKSLVFLLPAFAATVDTPEYGTVEKTLVIIPNKSLMDDTLKKATHAGVSCAKWTVNTSQQVVKDTALILVAIETLASYRFKQWYRDNEKVVKRFVIDECHQVITCDTFRTKFNAVKELAQYPVQKIFLTATLAVFLEDYFLQQLYLPRSTIVIREPTNRKNIIYHLLRVEQRVRKAKEVILDLAKLVENELWTMASRGIIFCLSRQEVDELAPFFGNTKSHSEMESSDRSEMQEKWNEGLQGNRWMVATTGFIHGIDHPNVDTVIFLEMPYGLNNFVQGGGRAGRSGRPAHVFLLDYCTTFIQPRGSDVDSGARAAGASFVKNDSECRRTILSDVMDGAPICCNDLLDAEPCDICKPDHPLVLASKNLLLPVRAASPDYDQYGWDDATLASIDPAILDSTAKRLTGSSIINPDTSPSTSLLLDQAIYLKLKRDKLAKVAELTAMTKAVGGILDGNPKGYCVICWVWKHKWHIKTPDHQYFIGCMTKEDGYVRHAIGWIQLKKEFRFEKYKYCWKCGLPQGEFSLATHPKFKSGTVMKCPFDDMIALLMWHIINTEEIWDKACTVFSGLKQKMNLTEVTKWLKAEEQPHLFYNGLELVIWYWVTYKDILLMA